jgi:hypothetical protein
MEGRQEERKETETDREKQKRKKSEPENNAYHIVSVHCFVEYV